jgi:type II secretion system (T2SS) protein N
MKRRTLVLTVIAGVAVFLVVLLLYLPAGWFASRLPPQVQCADIGGTLWQGECLGLKVNGSTLGDATWNFSPWRAASGRLAGDFDLRGSALNVRADLDTSFSGVGELRNVRLGLNLDPALLPQLPRDQRGMVNAELSRLELAPGPAPRAIEGRIEARDLRQVGTPPMDLGSYEVTFDGTTPPDGAPIGRLRDLGGPFMVEGTVKLTPPNAYLVQGFITGRTAAAERVVRDITLGAMPEASGRSPFSFEGSY